ncbi:MAG: GDP-mannose 4,6-dehydratase [Chloroflexota bacterium]|nr:GDP-mannose 4,6-dehydratase [Chloroflexota bacterium]MDQ5865207.1 GDP-mannose 4,6-dehydratase [Chloroflexota bacterium]
MRVLVTGITGFAGSHMAEFLAAEHADVQIFGIYRRRSRLEHMQDTSLQVNMIEPGVASVETIEQAFQPGKVNLIDCDLLDPFSTHKLIGAVRPDRIFHLAAQSHVPTSWNSPSATLQDNILGQLNIFEAIREAGIDPLIQIAGSSEEYGMVYPDEVPMKESNPLRPLSPYAVSKVTQEMLAYQYHQSYGIKSIVSRGFNHSGPRRGENFVDSSFAKQIAEIEKGKREPVIHVGDLTSKRDFTDVRDMVRAYWLLLEKCRPGDVYNIGSGNTRTMQEVLDMLLGMSRVEVEVRVDPTRLRPSDVMILWADATKFKEATGWEPTIPYEQTLRDTLDYWRERV